MGRDQVVPGPQVEVLVLEVEGGLRHQLLVVFGGAPAFFSNFTIFIEPILAAVFKAVLSLFEVIVVPCLVTIGVTSYLYLTKKKYKFAVRILFTKIILR